VTAGSATDRYHGSLRRHPVGRPFRRATRAPIQTSRRTP